MKKLKLNTDISEVLKAIKNSKYSFTFGPANNPTWLIIDENTKKVRFEYGEDIYDCKEVGIEFLKNSSEKNIESIVKNYLTHNGYDGLFNTCYGCGCQICDLMPCQDVEIQKCNPGYIHDDPSGEFNFIINSKK